MYFPTNGRFSTDNNNMKLVWESVVMAPVLLLLPRFVQGEVLRVLYSNHTNQHASGLSREGMTIVLVPKTKITVSYTSFSCPQKRVHCHLREDL